MTQRVSRSDPIADAGERTLVGAADFLHVETSHLQRIGGSSLTDDGMAVAEADTDSEEIPDSYVPFRNANLLSMAVSYAEARGASAVFIGAHSEDFSGYPDCRPAFFETFQSVVDVGTRPETEIALEAPFVEWAKTDIAERGLELGVPYADTWSCYRSDEPACGTCDACAFRLAAFQRLGERDPIPYETRPDYTD
jgi:7-cyano-7-deazaguanine synthase